MLNSVLNEGARGLQISQREMQKSAHEIAQLNIRSEVTATEVQPEEAGVLPPVEEGPRTQPNRDLVKPLVELKRQELLFTASAKVISVADKTVGSLLDMHS